jgi:segregation and condensation protein A
MVLDLNVTDAPRMTRVQLGDENCKIEARGKFSDKDAQDYIPNMESEQLRIDVPAFEGPLDLLLHLIKKHSMDIFDIPIVMITRKYLEALDEIATLDLDLAGDFLVMAASLAQIKSKMLLPPDEQAAQGEEEEEEKDPRAELVRRLLEYQKFKEVAAQLKEMHTIGSEAFLRRGDNCCIVFDANQPDIYESVSLMPIEVYDLIEMFAKAVANRKPQFVHAVQFEKMSVRARMTELIDFCRVHFQFDFSEALLHFQIKSKIDLIVIFLAILEMVRLKLIKVKQEWQSSVISLSVIKENIEARPEDLVADLSDEQLPN